MSNTPERGVVARLTAQALAFGVMLALVVIPANALFLDAYGAKWLPATYLGIAVFGTGASVFIARAARRTRLARVAAVSLASFAVLYAASWLILLAGGVWVSACLLVLFPVALQIGFVFIGGQAGRLLDVRQMKERFPRVVGGFSVGFLLGGLLGIPLLALLGSTEDLLLGATVAQLAFLGLLLETERRFPEVRAAPVKPSQETPRASARTLFASGLVLLLLVYQVLSAMGSWLADYLLFNRAHAHYSGDDLTRLLSWYTALLNLADILFLALIAGPLMRRFGLRIGLVLNPAVVAALLAAMAAVVAGPGAAAYSLFVLAAVARLSDIVLTDGTTRTSVNASFQVVPIQDRFAVQAVVEGIGVPVAIGATGAVLLLMNLLGLGIGAVIVFAVVLSVIWTASGAAMYRAYTRALADEMSHRSLVASVRSPRTTPRCRRCSGRTMRATCGSASTCCPESRRRLLPDRSGRRRSTRIPRCVCGRSSSSPPAGSLKPLRKWQRLRPGLPARPTLPSGALRRPPSVRIGSSATTRCSSVSSTTRIRLSGRRRSTPWCPRTRRQQEVVRRVVGGAPGARHRRQRDRRGPAARRFGRPSPGGRARPRRSARSARLSIRAAASAAAEHGLGVIEPALRDRDRVVVLAALDALDAAGGAGVVPPDLLDGVFHDAALHASRTLAARASLAASDGPLRRALEDESDLARRLVIAVLALRHGARVREAIRVVDRAEGQRRALGVEALDVLISREEAAVALPLVRRDLTPDEQAAALPHVGPSARGPDDWIAEMAEDPEGIWRSPWLALCARHVVGAAKRGRG